MYKETQARSSGGIEATDTTEMRDRARKRALARNFFSWHGILFEEPNPEREPPKRPN